LGSTATLSKPDLCFRKLEIETMKTKTVNTFQKMICSALLVITTTCGWSQITSWAKVYMNSSTAATVDVEVDATGNSYTVGNFASTMNANYGVNTANMMTAFGGQDIFITKHDATGTLLWVKHLGGSGDELPVALDVDASGNVVIAGTFTSTNMDFDPGTGVTALSSTGSTDLFVLKLNTSGNFVWAQRSGGTQGELMSDVEFDTDGNIYVAGSFTTINDFFSNTNTLNSGGSRDAFLCKLNSAGTYQWVKVIGGAGTDTPNRVNVIGGNVVITTDIGSGSTTFDFGTGTKNGTFSGTGTNGIMTHYYTSGTYAGKYQFTGNTSLTKVISSGSVTMAIGSFEGSMDVDPSATTNTITSKGVRDMFVIVLNGISDGTYRSHIVGKGATSVGQVIPVNVMAKIGANSGMVDLHIVGYAKASADMGGTIASDIVGPNNTNEYAFFARYTYNEGLVYNEMSFAANIAECGTAADFSKGTGVAVKSNGDILTTGWYRSTSVNSVTFNPGATPTITPIFSTSIGFMQYIKNCTMPTTTAATTTYSICSGASATLTGTGATTYSWNTGATTANITVSPTTTTTYTLTGINGECSKTDTVKIIVKTPPTTLAVANDYSICHGTSAILTGSGATTYSWNTGATTTSITVNPIVTTTYTLTGTTNGCTKTDTVKITVSASPNTLAVANDYSICSGTSVTLTGSGATSYSWTTGGTTASISVTPTTTTTYTLTGSNGTCSKTDTVKVIVTASPTTVATTTTYSICAGQSAVLTATGASTYAWNTGGATGPSTTVTPTTTTTYTVTGYLSGCSKTDTVKVTVKALPNTIASTTTPTVCLGSSAVLVGSGATTYSWNIGGTTSSITETPNGTTTYTLTGTTNGCSKSDTVKLTVRALPPIVASTTTYGICIGSSATLTASGGSSYTWNTGSMASSYTVTPTTTTTYTVTGSLNGCTKTDTVKVTVKSIPVTVASSNLYTPCASTSTTLNGTGATTYSWSTGATTAQTSVSPATTTVYTLTGSTNGCSSTDTVKLTINPTPVTPTSTTPGANLSICSNTTTTLSASGIGSITWFDVLTGGVALATGTNFTTPSLANSKIYYAQASSGCGTSARLPISVTVNNTAVAPSNTTQISSICIGASANLKASASGTIKWYSVQTGGSVIATGTTYATPNLSVNTTYYAENNSTCGISTRTAIPVMVQTVPSIPTVPSVTLCGSESKTITASSSHTVRWFDSQQSTESFFTGNTYTTPVLSANTTYYLEGYNVGCTSTSRVALTITANPLPTITSTQNTAICAGNTTSVNATGNGTITWYADQNTSTVLFTGNTYATPVLNTNTSFYAVNTNACGATPRLQVSVPVNPLPVIPVNTTSPSALTICPNASTTLSVNSVDPITWFTAINGGNSIATGAIYTTPNLNVNTSYFASSSNGCGTGQRIEIAITISSSPTAPSNISSPNKLSVCEGTVTDLTANASGTINWYNVANGGQILASGENFNTPNLTVPTTYYAENQSTCGTSARTPIQVVIKALPTLTASLINPICPKTSASANVNSNSDVRWFVSENAESQIATGIQFTTPILNQSTNYYVEAYNTCGTSSRTKVEIPVKQINLQISVNQNELVVNETNATFAWVNCETKEVQSATNNSFTPTNLTGIYSVIVTKEGCVDTSACVSLASNSLGMDEVNANIIKLYPVPATSNLVVENLPSSVTQIRIVDLAGKVLYQQVVSQSVEQLDVHQLLSGSYLLQLVAEEGITTKSFVVAN
jgi:hypothetical protein